MDWRARRQPRKGVRNRAMIIRNLAQDPENPLLTSEKALKALVPGIIRLFMGQGT